MQQTDRHRQDAGVGWGFLGKVVFFVFCVFTVSLSLCVGETPESLNGLAHLFSLSFLGDTQQSRQQGDVAIMCYVCRPC